MSIKFVLVSCLRWRPPVFYGPPFQKTTNVQSVAKLITANADIFLGPQQCNNIKTMFRVLGLSGRNEFIVW
jgi:hypothetical protein